MKIAVLLGFVSLLFLFRRSAAAPAFSFPGIDQVSAVPNPVPAGTTMTLAYHLLGPAASVEVKLYTPALTLAADWPLGSRTPVVLGSWLNDQLTLPPLAEGLYFVQVSATADGVTRKSPVKPVYLLH
jgi:hypothetical protein